MLLKLQTITLKTIVFFRSPCNSVVFNHKGLAEREQKSSTFNSWQGVCPKLFIIPSKAFLSFSSVKASKSTAPGSQLEWWRIGKKREHNPNNLIRTNMVNLIYLQHYESLPPEKPQTMPPFKIQSENSTLHVEF